MKRQTILAEDIDCFSLFNQKEEEMEIQMDRGRYLQ